MPTLMMVVLALVTVFASWTYSIVDPMQTSWTARAANTMDKLHTVEMRLTGFMLANGRLPCPADGQYPEQTQYFGVEAGNQGTCTGGTPAAPLGPDAGTGYIVGGTIPTRALHLSDDYGFDEWGHRITYVVDSRATKYSSCISLEGLSPSNPTATGVGGIKIESTTGGTVLDNVMHAFIVHGPSGHGAWPIQGSSTTLTSAQSLARRINTGAHDADENANLGWSNDGNYTYSTTNWTNVQVMKDPVTPSGTDTGFDQIVYYAPYQKNLCCVGSNCISYGIRIDGIAANQNIGSWVNVADINGDGMQDLIFHGTESSGADAIFVIFAKKGGITPDPFPVSSLDGTNGFKLYESGCGWGNLTPIIGDFNGDGIQDIAVTWEGPWNFTIIFGQASGWPAAVNICGLNSTSSPKAVGMSLGYDVYNNGLLNKVAASDINGDGISDLVLVNWDGPGATNAQLDGDIYVLYGSANILSTFPSNFTTWANSIDGTNGVHIEGRNQNALGMNIGFGDFNGDGIKDLLIGENYNGPGMFYVVWGHAAGYTWPNSGVIDMGALPANGSLGVQFNQSGGNISGYVGNNAYPYTLGDVNGDGIDDIQLGGHDFDVAGNEGGGVVTIFGKNSWTSNTFDISTIDGTSNGSILSGTWSGAGGMVGVGGVTSSPADINGDGIKDLITENTGYAGTGYDVIFGPTSGSFASPLISKSGSINGTDGFSLWMDGSVYAWGASTGDINGDGKSELIAGDPGANGNAGQAFVVKGGVSNYGSGTINSSNINSYGWLFTGANAGDKSGYASTALDLNNDGIQDLVIAAPTASPNGVAGAGSIYVVWGNKKGWYTPFSLGIIQ